MRPGASVGIGVDYQADAPGCNPTTSDENQVLQHLRLIEYDVFGGR